MSARRLSTGRPRQRGAAVLVVTVLLCVAMALGVAYVHRSLVIEQRTAAHQVRSTSAFEAAEAGLEWALAALNDNRRVADDCLPSTDPTALSLRDRMLTRAAADQPFAPVTWLDHGVATPMQATCEAVGGGWHCACPAGGAASPTPPPGATSSFRITLGSGDAQGLVNVVSQGCSGVGAACDGSAGNDTTARVAVSFGLLPGLASAPAAPLVAGNDIDGHAAAWFARNDDAAQGGIVVQAGGSLHAGAARLDGPAGSPTVDDVVEHDPSLAGRTPARFFRAFFGRDPVRWNDLPAVRHIVCNADCSAALASAIAAGGRNAMIAVDGDLTLATPQALGSDAQPVAIVASGAVRLAAPVEIHGLLYGASVRTDAPGSGSTVRGTVVAETDITIDDASSFKADAALIARLRAAVGSFSRVSGSWRDF